MATIQLPPDFRDFLRSLNLAQVEYLIVGGYAMAAHGRPRTTGDIDVWIANDAENAQRVVSALRAFGWKDSAVQPELFVCPNRVIRMGVPPLRIEILTGISGVEFRDCFTRRKLETLGDLDVPFIGREDLRANKRAAARAQDIADLEALDS